MSTPGALGLGVDLGVLQPLDPWKRELYRLDRLDLARAESLPSASGHGYEGYQQLGW